MKIRIITLLCTLLVSVMCLCALAEGAVLPSIDAECMFEGADDIVRADVMCITGTASPNAEGTLFIAPASDHTGTKYSVIADSEGRFSVELIEPMGNFYRLTLSIDGAEIEYRAFGRLPRDMAKDAAGTECVIAVDPSTEGDTLITGQATEGTAIVLYIDGEEAYRTTADYGMFSIEVDAPIPYGGDYELQAFGVDDICSEKVKLLIEEGSYFAGDIYIDHTADHIAGSVSITVSTEGLSVPVALYVDGELISSEPGNMPFTHEVKGLTEGSHVIRAVYDGYFAKHSGTEVGFVIDATAPVISAKPSPLIDTDKKLSVYTNEPTVITVRIGDSELSGEGYADVCHFDVEGVLKPGDVPVIEAMDACGNMGILEMPPVELAARAELALDAPLASAPYDAFGTVPMSGKVYVTDTDASLSIFVNGRLHSTINDVLPGGAGSRAIEAAAYIPFDIEIDASELPVGEPVEVEFHASVAGVEYELDSDVSFRLEKSRKQLGARIFILAGVVAVIVVLMLLYIRMSRKMAALHSRQSK